MTTFGTFISAFSSVPNQNMTQSRVSAFSSIPKQNATLHPTFISAFSHVPKQTTHIAPPLTEIIVMEQIISELTNETQNLITARRILQNIAKDDPVNLAYTRCRNRDIRELSKRIAQKSHQLTTKHIKLMNLKNKKMQS